MAVLDALPSPDVIRSYYDEAFHPHQPALCLDWGSEPLDRVWQLPEGISLSGPAPRRFGISIRRHGADAFQVRLLWDETRFHWSSVSRAQVMGCCLPALLEALGTDPWHLLDQPERSSGPRRLRAA
jgi:hypothetical protein